jgi:hypothetical protein
MEKARDKAWLLCLIVPAESGLTDVVVEVDMEKPTPGPQHPSDGSSDRLGPDPRSHHAISHVLIVGNRVVLQTQEQELSIF